MEFGEKNFTIGSAVTLSDIVHKLEDHSKALSPQLVNLLFFPIISLFPLVSLWQQKHRNRVIQALLDQLHWFAGTQIRNVASLGGNIVNASPISDLNPVWMATNATFTLASTKGTRRVSASDFFLGYKKVDLKEDEIVVSVQVPWNEKNEYVEAYKQSRRREDDIAIVTACFSVRLNSKNKVEEARYSLRGMAPKTVRCPKTETFFKGKAWTEENVQAAMHVLKTEHGLKGNPPGGMAEYRTALSLSFLFKFYVSVAKELNPSSVAPEVASATTKLYPVNKKRGKSSFLISDYFLFLQPTMSSGKQSYDIPKRGISVGDSEVHMSAVRQTTGEALYTDDYVPMPNEVHGALVTSEKAHAKILKVDASKALKVDGVLAFYSHKDVPGSNLWGDIVADEEIFVSEIAVHYGLHSLLR